MTMVEKIGYFHFLSPDCFVDNDEFLCMDDIENVGHHRHDHLDHHKHHNHHDHHLHHDDDRYEK